MELSGLQRWRGGRAVPGMPLTGTAAPLCCPETWALQRGCGGQGSGVPPGGLLLELVFVANTEISKAAKEYVLSWLCWRRAEGRGGSLRPYNPSSPPCSPGAARRLPAVQGGDAAPRWGLGAVTQGWDMQHGMSPVALALSADALLRCHRPAGPRCTGSSAHTNPALLLTASSFGRGEAEPLPPHATFFFVFFF